MCSHKYILHSGSNNTPRKKTHKNQLRQARNGEHKKCVSSFHNVCLCLICIMLSVHFYNMSDERFFPFYFQAFLLAILARLFAYSLSLLVKNPYITRTEQHSCTHIILIFGRAEGLIAAKASNNEKRRREENESFYKRQCCFKSFKQANVSAFSGSKDASPSSEIHRILWCSVHTQHTYTYNNAPNLRSQALTVKEKQIAIVSKQPLCVCCFYKRSQQANEFDTRICVRRVYEERNAGATFFSI